MNRGRTLFGDPSYPKLERPTYVDLAPPQTLGQAVRDLAAARRAARAAPDDAIAADDAGQPCARCAARAAGPTMTSLLGVTLFGVTAAYFAPAVFGWIGQRLAGADDDDTVEFEVSP